MSLPTPGDRVVFTPDVEWPRWVGERATVVEVTEPDRVNGYVWVRVRRTDGRTYAVRPFEVRVLSLPERIGELEP